MSEETPSVPTEDPAVSSDGAEIDGGSYEVIRGRLLSQARELGRRSESLNEARKQAFGGVELAIIGNERVRTENNCVPRDIVMVGEQLLFGYNVYIGLRSETRVDDVFAVHRFAAEVERAPANTGFDISALPVDDPGRAFLDERRFTDEFAELYRFYKDARLLKLSRSETKLLAAFQIGATTSDIRVFRWNIDSQGQATYVDNRGERDFAFPPSHDFEWTRATREHQVRGRHPHVSIDDVLFVETTGGDLTIKVENNTDTGEGIYCEPVDEPRQSLDDAEFLFANLGHLILLRIRPYNEPSWRHLVFATRPKTAMRVDAIGQSCVQLPEGHGIIFPGGYVLHDGQHKLFDGDHDEFEFERRVRSPNGEDVLYVFHRHRDGLYLLSPYNLIRRQVQTPVRCHGYSLFADGRMVVFRSDADEPTRVHAMQVWRTPFCSAEHAAAAPSVGGMLGNIGNAELVRGISDAHAIRRMIEAADPSRQIFEDLVAAATRSLDAYHWFADAEAGDIASLLKEIRSTAELVVDEFDKVTALREQAHRALDESETAQASLLASTRTDGWTDAATFMDALTRLRSHRGHLISLREIRYVDLGRLDEMERETIEAFSRVSRATVEFLADPGALEPVAKKLDALCKQSKQVGKTPDLAPVLDEIEHTGEGLTVLSEIVSGLDVDDPTVRTQVLERVSEVFGLLNRSRATVDGRRRELLAAEGRAEFAVQFKLFGQAVSSAINLATTPQACEAQLARLLIALEELEARFGEFDEFIAELTTKREDVYEAFGQKKQQLLDERQRRAATLASAADRILTGMGRRAEAFNEPDELNAFFASDPMVLKLRELVTRLRELDDATRADEVESRLKSTRQAALRGLRDRVELHDGGADQIRLGRHRFAVNTQALALTLLPHDNQLYVSLAGTDLREPITDEAFLATRPFWSQHLVSETDAVYRGEYLAASMLFAAEARREGLDLDALVAARHEPGGLLERVRRYATDRYSDGYERGVHDSDAAAILDRVLTLHAAAGRLRFRSMARAVATMFWAHTRDHVPVDGHPTHDAKIWHRRAQTLARVQATFGKTAALAPLAAELTSAIARFALDVLHRELGVALLVEAGRYLATELTAASPRFVAARQAVELRNGLAAHLRERASYDAYQSDVRALGSRFGDAVTTVSVWMQSYAETLPRLRDYVDEAVALELTEHRLDFDTPSVETHTAVEGLLGRHGRIEAGTLALDLPEFLARLHTFCEEQAPAYRRYRQQRQTFLEREHHRLRVDEYLPRVLSSFVRNRLVNEVYLPLIGDNLAKQIGAAGESKRTDLMGLLLLISPPGYGKTTLMEYVASRLGLVFMKINGPSLGHAVTSLDPNEAPNATSRQEVDKINLALEMGNNVMLYLDDIQHTNPELLQKFISLCDAQRRIEGVWRGRTRTYDLRGKRVCVVMAGNPYTESGEKFQIPDMLANRADTYNLGDVLEGRDEVFALSYIENAITSNPVLAPMAAREQADIYAMIRLAQGEDVPSTAFRHGYSKVELDEICGVLRRLFSVQRTLLAVNREYIASASMDDRFRTEPPFKLQGSYRNMNKLAEKVVAVMNDRELDALIEDHYAGEAQTLTSGAEHNMLKLLELRGRLDAKQSARWEAIKKAYRKAKAMGGAETDPVTRVTGTLAAVTDQLEGIRSELAESRAQAATRQRAVRETPSKPAEPKPASGWPSAAGSIPPWVRTHLEQIHKAIETLAQQRVELTVKQDPPPGVEELLAQQVAIIERTLVPLVRTATAKLDDRSALEAQLERLFTELRAVDARLRGASPS